MARETVLPIDESVPKKIFIAGQGPDLEHRYALVARMRPTVVKRLRELTVGPLYLAIEYAVEELLSKLEKAKEPVYLDASKMALTSEDIEIFKAAKKTAAKELKQREKKKEKDTAKA